MKNTIRTIVFGMAAMSFLRYAIAKDIIVVVPAHPDDLIPCFGTCLLSKDIFEWHVIEFTHGERGMGEQGYRDGSTKKIRMAEEGAVCKELGAKLHWLDHVDVQRRSCCCRGSQVRRIGCAVYFCGRLPFV